MAKPKQDDRYDWLGDAGEAYVRYLFACEKFKVYGAGKWTADAAIYDPKGKTPKGKRWWRVEVKSTDRATGFRNLTSYKRLTSFSKKADLLVMIHFVEKKEFKIEIIHLSGKKRGKRLTVKDGGIRTFLYS